MLTNKTIKINGQKCSYWVSGDTSSKVAVVFLPSGANIGTEAEEVRLTSKLQLIAIDYPGRGQSHPIDDNSFQSLAKYCWKIIDSLTIERVYLVGFSFGGVVAIEMMKLRPHLVSGALLGATGKFFTPSVRRGLKKIFLPAVESDQVMDVLTKLTSKTLLAHDSAHKDSVSLLKQWLALLDYDLPKNLKVSFTGMLAQIEGDKIVDPGGIRIIKKMFSDLEEVYICKDNSQLNFKNIFSVDMHSIYHDHVTPWHPLIALTEQYRLNLEEMNKTMDLNKKIKDKVKSKVSPSTLQKLRKLKKLLAKWE